MMRVLTAAQDDAVRWDRFLDGQPSASNYHRWGWRRVVESSFSWPTYYLLAEEDGAVRGVLPLVWQKSWMFGSFLSSMPFFNFGGVVAETPAAERALVEEAVRLAQQLNADHLELRHRHDCRLPLPVKTGKVAVVRQVCADPEQLLRSLDKKVRADVRKSQKAGFIAEFGGDEFLEDFYRVFAINMRDLGTPVYSRSFFHEIRRVFPDDTWICRVRLGHETVAAAFLSGFRQTLEVPWAASIHKYLPLKPNMFLYWNLLCFAGQKGCQMFDFGRSTVGSGTHKFKMQWGGEEVPMYWHYWVRGGAGLPEVNPHNPKYRLAIWAWQKLPVWVTRRIGPPIVRCLP